jgi:iron(III) transport system ATP-binding protein
MAVASPVPAVRRRPLPLELRDVGVSIGRADLLRDVSVQIAPGSRTAVVGPSGAGKTTLLRLIVGVAAPTTGTLRLGETVAAQPGRIDLPARRRDLGYLPQDLGIWEALRVRGHLDVVLRAREPGLSRADRRDRIGSTLAAVRLDALAARRAGALSGGERTRLALARILVSPPAIWLLDEPFAALDFALRDHVIDVVTQAVRDRGATLILVTHSRDDLIRPVDQLIAIDRGCCVAAGPPAALREHTDAAIRRFAEAAAG